MLNRYITSNVVDFTNALESSSLTTDSMMTLMQSLAVSKGQIRIAAIFSNLDKT